MPEKYPENRAPQPSVPDTAPDSTECIGRPSYLPGSIEDASIPPTVKRETEFWAMGKGLVLSDEAADALLEAQRLMSEVYESGVLEQVGLDPHAKGWESNRGHSMRDAVTSLLMNEEVPPHAKVRSLILATAAIFHDIGKLDRTINPVVMSDERYPADHPNRKIIERHPIIGAEVVRSILPQSIVLADRTLIANAIRQHHERMNGSGYPDNLKGRAICREARILAIADVADAIGEQRPYKPILPPKRTIGVMQQYVDGGLFDREYFFAYRNLYGKSGMIVRHRSSRPEGLA